MHYLVQDVIFISLVLIGFLALFQGGQILLKWLGKDQPKPGSAAKLAVRNMNKQP